MPIPIGVAILEPESNPAFGEGGLVQMPIPIGVAILEPESNPALASLGLPSGPSRRRERGTVESDSSFGSLD